MDIGSIFKKHRLDRNIKSGVAAADADIDQGSLSRFELHDTPISLEALKRLSLAINTPLSYIFAEAEGVASHRAIHCAKKISLLPDHFIDEIEEFIDYKLAKYKKESRDENEVLAMIRAEVEQAAFESDEKIDETTINKAVYTAYNDYLSADIPNNNRSIVQRIRTVIQSLIK